MNYEIVACGFNGATDATDDRILWVSAPDEATLYQAVDCMPHKGISDLPGDDDSGIDYVLPEDTDALRAKLEAFARDVPAQEVIE